MDVRSQLDRLQPAYLRDTDAKSQLVNEHKKRVFFLLVVDDSDFLKTGTGPMSKQGSHLKVSYQDNQHWIHDRDLFLIKLAFLTIGS